MHSLAKFRMFSSLIFSQIINIQLCRLKSAPNYFSLVITNTMLMVITLYMKKKCLVNRKREISNHKNQEKCLF